MYVVGKTTELLQHKQGKTLILNHSYDTRTEGVSTHDGVEEEAVKCMGLPDCSGYDTVLIDEAQFFDSLDGVENLAKNVVVAGSEWRLFATPVWQSFGFNPKSRQSDFFDSNVLLWRGSCIHKTNFWRHKCH